jgi:hypothetical protein
MDPPDGEKFDICIQCQNLCIANTDKTCIWCVIQNLDNEILKQFLHPFECECQECLDKWKKLPDDL